MTEQAVSQRCAEHRPRFVAIYLRISSTDTRLGVERQLAACTKLAEAVAPGIEVRIYEDNDTTAAREDVERPEWRRLVDDLKRGEISALIGWHQDRMFRLDSDFAEIKRVIKQTKTPIWCATQGKIELSSPTGALVAGLVQRVSEYEIEHARERLLDEQAQRRAAGKWHGGRPPLGYDVVRVDGESQLVINEDEAAALKSLAASLLDSVPLRVATRQLNERLGLSMRPTAARQSIMRPGLAGFAVHKGEIVGQAQWEPILDEQTHYGLVALLKDPARRRATSTATKHLGSGLYRCGVCGSDMTSNIRPTGPTYICRENFCVARKMSYVDEFVIKIAEALLLDERVILELTRSQRIDVAPLLERRRKLDESATNLAKMVSAGIFTPEQALAGAIDANRERAEIEQQIARAAQSLPGRAVFTAADPVAAFVSADLLTRRSVIDQLITVKVLATGRNPRFSRESIDIEPKLAVELQDVS